MMCSVYKSKYGADSHFMQILVGSGVNVGQNEGWMG